MKNRIELAEYFRDLGFKKGLELGVCDGRYSRILMDTIPGLTLYGVDPYRVYSDYTDYRKQTTMDGALSRTREALRPFEDYILLMGTSRQIAPLFADGSLDFIFIDANHRYPFIREDLDLWVRKVRKGGIASGHDYYTSEKGTVGVVKAVNEFVERYGYNLQTTEYDPDAHRDDRQEDWWFLCD